MSSHDRAAQSSFQVGAHLVEIERLEKTRWRARVDGKVYATFCTESRARSAARSEARRRDYALVGGSSIR